MDQKVTVPLGWEAGQERTIGEALQALAIEILAHKEDLKELASRRPDQAEEMKRHAGDLDRYGTALWLLWYQVTSPEDRNRRMSGDWSGIAEKAKQLNLSLPPGLG